MMDLSNCIAVVQDERGCLSMPRSTAKTSGEAPYRYFADSLQSWVLKYRLGPPIRPYLQKDAAREMGMSPAVFSRIVQGRERPSPEQCLAIARYFGVDVESVLRAAGYQDLAELRAWVEQDTTPRNEPEKQYILDVLRIALSLPEWQQERWDQSPYKDRAERALASSRAPYERAIEYADAVYDWGHSTERRTPRGQRNTGEIASIVS